MKRMSVRLPSLEQIRELGGRFELVLPLAQTTALQRACLHPSRGLTNSCRQVVLLRQAYDDALKDVAPISPGEAPFAEFIDVVLNMTANTCSFDVSEPSAFTVPCGLVGGLLVGLMLVVRLFEEATCSSLSRQSKKRR